MSHRLHTERALAYSLRRRMTPRSHFTIDLAGGTRLVAAVHAATPGRPRFRLTQVPGPLAGVPAGRIAAAPVGRIDHAPEATS